VPSAAHTDPTCHADIGDHADRACLCSWKDPAYLPSVLGRRTVPVEVGEHYLHPAWSQKLTTFSSFWATCMRSVATAADKSTGRSGSSDREGPLVRGSSAGGADGCEGRSQCGIGSAADRANQPTKGAVVGGAGGRRKWPRRMRDVDVSKGCFGAGSDGGAAWAQQGYGTNQGWLGGGVAAAGDAGQGCPQAQGDEEMEASPEEVQYLAQHQLFDQVPALRRDIMVRSARHSSRCTMPRL
jgi:hypothetical protein